MSEFAWSLFTAAIMKERARITCGRTGCTGSPKHLKQTLIQNSVSSPLGIIGEGSIKGLLTDSVTLVSPFDDARDMVFATAPSWMSFGSGLFGRRFRRSIR